MTSFLQANPGSCRYSGAALCKLRNTAHPQDVTLVKSLGIAIEDLAVAARIYRKALAASVGTTIEC